MVKEVNITLIFPKKFTKKSMELISSKLTEMKVIKKVNPKKVEELTENGDLTMKLIDGVKVECHRSGCFHFDCKDFDEQKLKRVSKAFVVLSEVYDIGKETEEAEFWFFAKEEKVPSEKIMKLIRKGIKSDFEARLKDLYKEDVRVVGARFISASNLSFVVDVSGITVRMGPRKMALDRFKDETTVINLVEESLRGMKKIFEV